MDAVPVRLPRPRVREIAVPDEVGALAQLQALELAAAFRLEQAELDALGALGIEGEIDARAVPGGT
jgi:hypothetical protein